MDPIGRFIATIHQMLGHDKGAAFMGVDPGPKDRCVICAFERNPTPAAKQAVIDAIGTSRAA